MLEQLVRTTEDYPAVFARQQHKYVLSYRIGNLYGQVVGNDMWELPGLSSNLNRKHCQEVFTS